MRTLRPRLTLPLLAATALVVTGCSATAEEETTSAGASASDDLSAIDDSAIEDQATPGPGGMGGGGGLVGLVAAVDGSTFQLQSADSQTAVTWDEATTVERTVEIELADVEVGSCAVVRTATVGEESATPATAVAVVLTAAADEGTCDPMTGVGGGVRPTMPEGAEGDLPELPEGELPEGMGGFGAMVVGVVTAVEGSTLTVGTESGTEDGTGGESTTTVVAVAETTTLTSTVVVGADDIAVGLCAQVVGEADDRGAVSAAGVTLSEAGEDGCTAAAGRLGGGLPAGAPAGEGSADA